MNYDKITIVVFATLILIIGIGLIAYEYRSINETVTLDKQYIGDISSGCAGGCQNCLIMEVSKDGNNMTYYFAGEHEKRYDLPDGGLIDVRWEYNSALKEHRIVNVDQHKRYWWMT